MFGAPGIALGNTIAFTSEAILLLLLLRSKYPQVLNVGKPLLRALFAGAAAALAAYMIIQLPLSTLLTSLGALAAGGVLVLLIIWTEIKTLLKL